MPDIFLYAGEPNPNDIRLGDPTALRGGGGATSYSYTGSGGFVLAGAATYAIGKSYPVSGGLLFAGAATVKLGKTYSPSGGVQFGGAGTVTRSFSYGPTGGLVFAGTALVVVSFSYTATGGLVFGGTADVTGPAPEAPPRAGGWPYANSRLTTLEDEEDEMLVLVLAIGHLLMNS